MELLIPEDSMACHKLDFQKDPMQDFISKLNDLLDTEEARQIPEYGNPSSVHAAWIYRLRKLMEEHHARGDLPGVRRDPRGRRGLPRL